MSLNRNLITSLVAAVVIVAAMIVPQVVLPRSALPEAGAASLAARLDDAITARIAQMGIPGAIVSLSIPGRTEYVKGFGVASPTVPVPLTPDFHFRTGSVTKTFTGTAILQLAERGLVDLDAPVSRYISGVPHGDEITIDMLGRMRSGLAEFAGTEQFVTALYAESPKGPWAFPYPPRKALTAAFRQPMSFPPNATYQYSNTNAVLLARVIEKVSGMPFDRYLQRHILGPAGLSKTSYPADGWLPFPFSGGTTKDDPRSPRTLDATLWNPSWSDAAGKVVSTVGDLRKWARMLSGGTLLRPSTRERRVSNGTPVAPGVDYAFTIFDADGWVGHNGELPGYTTVAVHLPERNATLVVSANSDHPQPSPAGQIAYDVTRIATPGHVYELGPQPPLRGAG
ncbi:serine hydrolase domain-containing protein [Gordonia sp. GN26]